MQKVKFIHATLVMVIIAASSLPQRPTPRPFVFKGGSMSRPAAPPPSLLAVLQSHRGRAKVAYLCLL